MTEEEQHALKVYLQNGGVAAVYGFSAVEGCKSNERLPTAPHVEDPKDFFCTVRDGVWIKPADWMVSTEFSPSNGAPEWTEVRPGLYYNPSRISDGKITQSLLDLVTKHQKPLPIEILESTGYLITLFEDENTYVIRMLAEDYDTDIDHKLDEIRFHRSRVNLINHVEPIGVTQRIRLKTNLRVEAFTPFNTSATVKSTDGICTVHLPEKASFILLRIFKE